MALLLVAGLVEGFGVLALLPLLEVAVAGTPDGEGAGAVVIGVLRALGLEPGVGVLLAAVVIAIALKGLLRWAALVRVASTVAGVAAELRLEVVRALLLARWRHFEILKPGHVATAVGRDAYWAAHAYRHGCAALAGAVEVLVHAALIVWVSWRFGVVALGAALALSLPVGLFVRASRRAGEEQTRRAGTLATALLDVVAGVKTIRAMAREGDYRPRLEREARALEVAERRQVAVAEALRSLQEPLLVLALAPAVWVALVVLSVPFPTLLVGIFLFHRLVVGTHRIQSEVQAMAGVEAAFRSVRRITLAARAERESWPGKLPPPPLRAGVVFRDVDFARGGQPVLAGVSLEVPAGGFTTVTGSSGAGKTTLLDLLLGLHRADGGGVFVDGVPLEEIDIGAWRSRIGYVAQETVLLHDTVLANVTLGDDSVPSELVERALRRAGAQDFVDRLPDGVRTVVGERGARLSGGERQRLAIARALLHDPVLLVLDEATSELDLEAEEALCEILRRLRGRTTVLATSHRPALARAADHVIDLEGGRVVPSGREGPLRPPLTIVPAS